MGTPDEKNKGLKLMALDLHMYAHVLEIFVPRA